MAYYLRSWLSVQGSRLSQLLVSICHLLLCCTQLKGRMRNGLSFSILGILGLLLISTAYNCSGSHKETVFVEVEPKSNSQEISRSVVVKQMANKSEDCSKTENVFSVTNMSFLFQKCASSELAGEVVMDSYLDAWEELIRFLNSMGTAFSFVGSDVVEKVGILRNFRTSAEKENYLTIERMIKYEKENSIINYNDAPSKKVKASGSRTLLRLHRALKFLLILIGKLAKNEDDGKVSLMGHNAYHASPMSKYHPWLVRKAVGLAVYMLPDRDTFIKQMCQDLSKEELTKTMQQCSESMDAVYEYTHALYSKYEITEIP